MKWYLRSFENNKYVKQAHHCKKEENPLQPWRDKVTRDKKKSYNRSYSGVPRYLKKMCNKRHRAHERQLIDREQFEKFHKTKRKDLFDPWMYW